MIKKTFQLFVALFFGFFLVFVVLLQDQICLGSNITKKAGLEDSAWPCKGHDARRSSQSPYGGMQTDSSLKWSYQTGNVIWSSPAIGVEGTIYVGGYDGKVYALNPNGSLKWSYLTDGPVISSPAIDSEGIIYVGSVDSRIYAFNPEGSLKWSYLTGGGVRSSPAIGTDGTIYIGSSDNNIYALNPDGSLKWSYQTGSHVRSSPAIGTDGTIYIGSDDGKVYAINSVGSLKWSFEVGLNAYTTPVIGADGTVYAGLDHIYALNPEDGSLKWSYNKGINHFSSPAIGTDGMIFLIQPHTTIDKSGCCINCFGPQCKYNLEFYGMIYALDSKGILKWTYRMGSFFCSESNIQSLNFFRFPGSFVPILAGDGTVYAGNYDGKVYALDPNGTLIQTYQTGGHVFSSPAIGADGTVYVGSNDGKLRAFGRDKYWYFDTDPNIQGSIFSSKMSLPAGWSMFSLPLTPENTSVSSLFSYAGVIYGYEKGKGYVRITKGEDLKTGTGYWILLNVEKAFIITGEIVDQNNLTVQDGWYMIGGCTNPAKASVVDGKIRVIYGYDQGLGYQTILESEELKPGKGYWILLEDVLDQCELTVKVTDPNIY